MVVIGIQPLDFKDNKGAQVVGTKLYFSYRMEGVSGLACDSKFFANTSPFYREVMSTHLGDTVDLMFSPKGQLIDYRLTPGVPDAGPEPGPKAAK